VGVAASDPQRIGGWGYALHGKPFILPVHASTQHVVLPLLLFSFPYPPRCHPCLAPTPPSWSHVIASFEFEVGLSRGWVVGPSQDAERLALLEYPEWMVRPRRERAEEAQAKLRASSTHVRRRERLNGPSVARRPPDPATAEEAAARWPSGDWWDGFSAHLVPARQMRAGQGRGVISGCGRSPAC
jgi:hypothetical protein